MSSVWLVWDGEFEPTLTDVCATQATAERLAHDLRKAYSAIKGRRGQQLPPAVVTVEERQVIS